MTDDRGQMTDDRRQMNEEGGRIQFRRILNIEYRTRNFE